MTIRRAIITFDEDRLKDFDYQAEGKLLGWIIMRALQGRDYPRERGIISVKLMEKEDGQRFPPARSEMSPPSPLTQAGLDTG